MSQRFQKKVFPGLVTGFGLTALTSRVLAAEPGLVEVVVPPDPLPWSFVLFLGSVLIFVGGMFLYFFRIVFGDKTVRISPDVKKQLEKSYAERLSTDFKKKDETLKAGLKDLRRRFSMVFMKVRNLTSTLDPEEVFKAITDIFSQEVEAAKFIIFLHDREKDEIYPYRWFGYAEGKKPNVSIPMKTDHLLTYAFRKHQVVYKMTAIDDPETRGLIDREPLNSTLLAVPLATEKESLGVIHIEMFNKGKDQLYDEDLKFISALSSFTGLALSNANVLLQTREELTSTKQLSEKELAEKKRLKQIFSKYASEALVDTLIANPGSVKLGGVQKDATILFSDIAGFTKFSSNLAPVEVVTAMNEYLSAMAEVVLNNEGEIDKFIGDAVMARFGVLVDLPSPGLSAVKTALAMLDELKKIQTRWMQEKREIFSIRIGIASGPVLAGNIGSERRQEFTVMGSTVNLASRLEALNKELKTTILIDENTFRQISQEVRAVPRENISIRGMEGQMTVYEVLGYHSQAQPKSKIISFKDRVASSQNNSPVVPAETRDQPEEQPEKKPARADREEPPK